LVEMQLFISIVLKEVQY